jgi:hypothetical protein
MMSQVARFRFNRAEFFRKEGGRSTSSNTRRVLLRAGAHRALAVGAYQEFAIFWLDVDHGRPNATFANGVPLSSELVPCLKRLML